MGMEGQPKEKLRLDKLIDATDIEGTKNQEAFNIARDIEKKLSLFPNFVGVVPFGSRVKGYSSEEKGSDYDMDILIDGDMEMLPPLNHLMDFIDEQYLEKGIKIHLNPILLTLNEILTEIKYLDEPRSPYVDMSSFKPLLEADSLLNAGIGPKINVWREKVKSEISKLPSEKKERMYQKFTDSLLQRDESSLKKISERIQDFNREEYLNARRKLWNKRVRNLFGEQKSSRVPLMEEMEK